jgi:hypothetical protein
VAADEERGKADGIAATAQRTEMTTSFNFKRDVFMGALLIPSIFEQSFDQAGRERASKFASPFGYFLDGVSLSPHLFDDGGYLFGLLATKQTEEKGFLLFQLFFAFMAFNLAYHPPFHHR